MKRRRSMLDVAQLPGEPLGEPEELGDSELQAWRDIVAACPEVLRALDTTFVRALAMQLAMWRAGRQLVTAREFYRDFGELLMPMRERRRLLFPDRPKRKDLS